MAGIGDSRCSVRAHHRVHHLGWSWFLDHCLIAVLRYSLVSKETMKLGVRMVLKSIVAVAWIVAFSVLYARMWEQKNETVGGLVKQIVEW
ncbi:hypothetical protein IFM89_016918 [Coptis chinensis]|uniref:Uncharacterized protein n=1 Tax=Coptis chinensis TaxID=261450 RepID=A0A835LS04_9MAGN|nr:hypothetical protein IFM89_016918 [Coptis chinensis]